MRRGPLAVLLAELMALDNQMETRQLYQASLRIPIVQAAHDTAYVLSKID
jgi:hypothetical protein